MGKRKLAVKSSSNGLSIDPSVKRICSRESTEDEANKTLTGLEYAQLKQFLKEKKKILKVSRVNYLFHYSPIVNVVFAIMSVF